MLVILGRLDGLGADAVCRDQRHNVRRRVTLHTAPPVRHGIAVENRLGTDGGRVEQQFSALQRHAARGLREPLVPANTDADFRISRIPDLEAGISGRKIELFLIKMVIRNVGLAILTHDRAVRVNDSHRVERGLADPLVVADRNDDLEITGNGLHLADRRIFLECCR